MAQSDDNRNLDMIDQHFDDWNKNKIPTVELSKRIKAMGYSHDRLDPRGPAGSIGVYGPDGTVQGHF